MVSAQVAAVRAELLDGAFKQANAELGHHLGDRVLQVSCERLRSVIGVAIHPDAAGSAEALTRLADRRIDVVKRARASEQNPYTYALAAVSGRRPSA
ncbi:hypothetical protein OPU71_18265 [Niveibacterium sp. 24ML]|uniref:hypothetical protein n=1 Tax=Niveibacterium sp. 24ML TaxID=2985512 RepID=UPI0022710DED|nr:hypothetical protein [Niveibacterium sp. 24ML]MCX9158071.1 hypothetical protein [Niveibacterium sp. 24ML]